MHRRYAKWPRPLVSRIYKYKNINNNKNGKIYWQVGTKSLHSWYKRVDSLCVLSISDRGIGMLMLGQVYASVGLIALAENRTNIVLRWYEQMLCYIIYRLTQFGWLLHIMYDITHQISMQYMSSSFIVYHLLDSEPDLFVFDLVSPTYVCIYLKM